jgi:hypothetical protein
MRVFDAKEASIADTIGMIDIVETMLGLDDESGGSILVSFVTTPKSISSFH